ncbi:UNKNOWN [Stylonychia lemnae]|uniref:Uncharacterized protein n=1 Tax=Stylonychia lemnae TaxID=5949 RepID=A0A077ZZG8_STYLE|nr:UNKNOWN [Stylonychia lemnae]|eukprot:CDW73903.1 UNKNOWN [Stylonychia lemnae]
MEKENQQLAVGVPLVVWGASITLSNWIDENFERLPTNISNCLELGSGTGLLGIYTLKRIFSNYPETETSIHMTFTDMEQSSLELIEKNMDLNKISKLNGKASYFKWGDFTNEFTDSDQYDLIVGSDIIYSDRILEPLAQSISHLLKKGGLALIANNSIRYDIQAIEFERQLALKNLIIEEKVNIKDNFAFLENYEKFPRLLRAIQRYTPFFSNGIDQPRCEAAFVNPILKAQMGCGYISIIDSSLKVFSWGDNYAGQLGLGDDIHRDSPVLVDTLSDHRIVDMSLGFQHCLYLNDIGEVFGIGRNNRFQLGRQKDSNNQNQEIFDKYQGAVKLDYFIEPIVQIGAGKFHSVFLTVGFNKYGQCGISNSLFMHSEDPVEIFTDNLRIKEISVGSHHTLILSEDNRLYGFGARKNDGREEQCSIVEIKLPTDKKIVKFKASNLRNYIITEDNQVWFWGGYIYQNYQKLCIDDFNLLNEEEGIPKGKKIIDYGLGFAHDTVLIEEDEPKIKIQLVIDEQSI